MTSNTNNLPPQRMRDYRIEAELRDSPDLHKLAQVFIGMAQARAANEHRAHTAPQNPPAVDDADHDVES
ncbi:MULTISPECIES: hypothetical protein [Micrococcales]|jgi:hypothetical protein|uniref:Uncharacterized protein n=2 Tax=Micrococcales TaxID=85006 RepID=A0A1W2BNE1_9MICO|nr:MULTISPECIES: hypothetical protein [Micrococcales]MCL6422296.1 hypothetical protein [Brachybacterium equifaecis]OLT38379.1 hypothetical protein BJF82_08985 [Kytococcus sp. CUA-901]RYI22475.1 hypothetical protein EVU97_08840 [Dermacoccus sp. 147Ba]SMC74222.1 hypothetical protein SAMN06296429_108169 [Janibacter indicus]